MPDTDLTHSEETYELTNVAVDTLGLVTQGANRETFFLLKADETAPTEATLAETPNLWQRFLRFMAKAMDAELATLPEATATSTPETPADAVAEVGHISKAEAVEEIAEPVEPAIEIPVAEVAKEEPATEPIAETNAVPESSLADAPVVVETTKSGEAHAMEDTVEKSELAQRLTELEKANANLLAEIAKAQDERDRAAMLTKAQTYAALPVAPVELADRLHALAKWDAGQLTFWTDLLKSVDALVQDVYAERGSTVYHEQAQPDVVQTVIKSDDPRAALLSMSRKDAENYLRDVRNRVRKAQEG